MINGVHALIYTKDPEGARKLFKEVLGTKSVDAGRGWLIFALPPGEIAAHPAEDGNEGRHELYFMCDDVNKTIEELKAKGVAITSPVSDQGWGLVTGFKLPGGETIGLYQPRHPKAI